MQASSSGRASSMPGPDDLEFPGVVRGQNFPGIPDVLPHEKVFPIQIGSELFRLSGASISSDGMSYSTISLSALN